MVKNILVLTLASPFTSFGLSLSFSASHHARIIESMAR